MMQTIARLRKKYDLRMCAERYLSVQTPETESWFLRK